jgi:cytochrome c
MKSIIVSMIAAAGLMVAGSAFAAEMPALAKKMNCTACHAIDKKVVGPAWQDVANKYKGDAGAAAALQTKVSKGGSGAWGTMPMPANDAAGTKQAEIKELVSFILGLAK